MTQKVSLNNLPEGNRFSRSELLKHFEDNGFNMSKASFNNRLIELLKNGEIIGSDDQEASQNLYKYVAKIGDARLTVSQRPGKVTENLIVDNIVRMMRLEENYDEDIAVEKDMYDRAWEIFHDNERNFRLAANIGERLVPIEATEWGDFLENGINEFPLSHFMGISLPTVVASRLYDLKHKSENK